MREEHAQRHATAFNATTSLKRRAVLEVTKENILIRFGSGMTTVGNKIFYLIDRHISSSYIYEFSTHFNERSSY